MYYSVPTRQQSAMTEDKSKNACKRREQGKVGKMIFGDASGQQLSMLTQSVPVTGHASHFRANHGKADTPHYF